MKKNSEAPQAAATRTTKKDSVLALLRRDGGATLADMTAATDWLPHTARAMLTGLRKKGHAISKVKVDGVTRYFIIAEGQS